MSRKFTLSWRMSISYRNQGVTFRNFYFEASLSLWKFDYHTWYDSSTLTVDNYEHFKWCSHWVSLVASDGQVSKSQPYYFNWNICFRAYPANMCQFKVNNRNTRKMCEITIVFFVNFEHISHLFLLSLSLTLYI